MRRSEAPAVAAALLAAGLAAFGARAEGVIDRVARTGVLEAGTREEAVPFAFRNEEGVITGFSVDLLEAIRERLETELGREVALRLSVVTAQDRLERVRSGELAIECGITTATWSREDSVDFSIPFFENGTRVLTRRDVARDLGDLNGWRIGVLAASSTIDIVRESVPDAVIVEVADLHGGLESLLADEIDGFANVGIVLRAQIEDIEGKSRFVLLPRGGVMSWESMACVLPPDDSAWRDFVNRTISDLLDGVDRYTGPWIELYERWFGVQGEIFYPLDQETAQRLAAGRIWLE